MLKSAPLNFQPKVSISCSFQSAQDCHILAIEVDDTLVSFFLAGSTVHGKRLSRGIPLTALPIWEVAAHVNSIHSR